MADEYQLETLAVRAGIERSQFGEHSEALYLTSSFVFKSAAQAAARFANQEPGNIIQMPPSPQLADVVKALNTLGATPQRWRNSATRPMRSKMR